MGARLRLGLVGILLILLVTVASAAPPGSRMRSLRLANRTLRVLTETSRMPRRCLSRLKRIWRM